MKSIWYRLTFLAALGSALLPLHRASAAEDRILWYSIGDNLGSTSNIQAAINFCTANNFNAICYLARYRADAYYIPNRDFSTYSNPEPQRPASDTLQYAIDHGHEAGLRVYIAYSCFLVTDGSATYPSYLPSGSITYRYNSSSGETSYAPASGYPRAMTLADSSEGVWSDVGRADIRTYTVNVLKDIVQNYDIDGVILDRVRYPGDSIPHNTEAYGYNPTALSEMVGLGEIANTTPAPGSSTGAFSTARRNAVTRFVTAATNAVYALKPWVIMGSSPIVYSTTLNSTYNSVFQYFPGWDTAANPGHVSGLGNMDYIAPQYYRTDAATNASLMNLVNGDIDEVNHMKHLGTFDPGVPYASSEFAQSICDQRQKGMKGFGSFAYTGTSASGYVSGINSTNTSPCGTNVIATATTGADYTNKVGWDTTPPNPVTGASATGGFRTCTLNWTPPTTATDGDGATRYLIYRGTSNTVKQYYANQVAVTSTITGSSFTDANAPAGTFYYKIVPVDDYNNKGTAVVVGPVSVSGLDIYVESRTSGGTLTSSPTYAESGAFADTAAKSTAPGLAATGARYNTTVNSTATFKPNITTAGNYNVYVTLGSGSNNNAHATYTVTNSSTNRTGSVFLTTSGGPTDLVNDWHLLESSVPLPLGQTKGITLTNVDGNAAIGARFVMDAVRFELQSVITSVKDWSMY